MPKNVLMGVLGGEFGPRSPQLFVFRARWRGGKKVVDGAHVGDVEGCVGGYWNIGMHTGALPIGAASCAHHLAIRHGDLEGVVDRILTSRVGRAGC